MISAKSLCLLFVFFLFIKNSFAQSASQVIENYLAAIGGRTNLEKISSYSISGTGQFFGMDLPYFEYGDSNTYYMNLGSDTIKVMKFVMSGKNRWVTTQKEGKDTVTDISSEHHANWNKYFLRYNFFFFLLNYQKYGLDLELDSSGGTFNITFSESDTSRCVAEFSQRDFLLKKFIVLTAYERIFGRNELSYEFGEYKDVGTTGIKMPFTIVRNELVPIEVSEYVFNKKIDAKLLKKP
jgi:hypothetical protein